MKKHLEIQLGIQELLVNIAIAVNNMGLLEDICKQLSKESGMEIKPHHVQDAIEFTTDFLEHTKEFMPIIEAAIGEKDKKVCN